MSRITDEMLERFVYQTYEIENTLDFYNLKLDDNGSVALEIYDEQVEVYAITSDLTINDFERLPYEWEKFVDFKGDDKQIQAEAEKLQTILKEYYTDDYLNIEGNISVDLIDDFERFVAKNYEEVDDFENYIDFLAIIRISENSFNPEDLIQAREEELSNK